MNHSISPNCEASNFSSSPALGVCERAKLNKYKFTSPEKVKRQTGEEKSLGLFSQKLVLAHEGEDKMEKIKHSTSEQ